MNNFTLEKEIKYLRKKGVSFDDITKEFNTIVTSIKKEEEEDKDKEETMIYADGAAELIMLVAEKLYPNNIELFTTIDTILGKDNIINIIKSTAEMIENNALITKEVKNFDANRKEYM